MSSTQLDDPTEPREPAVTASDLLATSSGLAAGTVVGSIVGALTAAGPMFPIVLGVAGMAASGLGYRLLRSRDRGEPET